MDFLAEISPDPSPDTCFNFNHQYTEQVCGDCWQTLASNYVCFGMFIVFVVLLFLVSTLMLCYHTYRRKAELKLRFYSYYYIFIFVFIWILCRIAYFSDAFVNYSAQIMAILRQLPMLFTFSVVAIAIYNV